MSIVDNLRVMGDALVLLNPIRKPIISTLNPAEMSMQMTQPGASNMSNYQELMQPNG